MQVKNKDALPLRLFEFSERICNLLEEKIDAEAILREINREISELKNNLFEIMKKTDTQSFTHRGMTFYLIGLRPAPATVGVRKTAKTPGNGGGLDV